jgi:hypothetical protein
MRWNKWRRKLRARHPRWSAIAALGVSLCAFGQTGKLIVGIVKDGHEFHEGGCELLLPTDSDRSERYVFLSDFDGRAVMNINGRDTRLTLVRSNASDQPSKKGDRSSYWYKAGDLEVRVDYTVSGLCPPKDESCEAVRYTAVIQVTRQSMRQAVPAHGICGT